jgi:hypothetical protein
VLALAIAGCGGSSASPSAVSVGLVSSPADIARTAHDAVFTVDCTFAHRAKDDPIVDPGQPGASHSHDFYGNESTNAASTIGSLRGKPTTCADPDDTASYWAPTLYRGNDPVTAYRLRAYYRAVPGQDVTTVHAPPLGLIMLAGNHDAISPQPTSMVGWGCGFTPRRLVSRPPNDCTDISPLTMQLFFPNCWNGRTLDSADHRSHMAYSVDGVCPPDHPVPITQLQLTIEYPVWGPTGTLRLSSGPTITAHGDFMNSWRESRLYYEVELCIHAKANCTQA